MRLEWDEAKRVANLRKHGIDFIGAEEVFAGDTVTIEDERLDYGEQRLVTFGFWKEESSQLSIRSEPMSFGSSR